LKRRKELGMKTVPCEIKDLKTEAEICEWVIKDNLLRRQLTPEQRYLLYARLSEIYEIGLNRNEKGQFVSRDDTVSSRGDVLERTAREIGESPRTIARAREYKRVVEELPELKNTTVTSALNEYRRRRELNERKKILVGAAELKNLILGDALEEVGKIPDASVDLLLIDPPYGAGTEVARTEVIEIRGEDWAVKEGWNGPEIFDKLPILFERLKPKLKPSAHAYIFTSWKVWDRLAPIVRKYFEIKNCLIWDKGCGYLGELLGYNFMERHELILFATAGEKRKLNYTGEKPTNIISGIKSPYNVKRLHPTEKPVELCKLLISYSTVEGETVLDCFAGCGSTLAAAEELGRNWVGIEIDPKWHELAKARILELRKTEGGVVNA
jgi:site-specific DNA-methyltransferase (adenine-specific)